MTLAILGAIEIKRRTHRPGFTVYLASLRHFNPDTRVMWFVRGADPDLTQLAFAHDVETVDARAFDQRHGIPDVGLACGRFLEYRVWLQQHPEVDRVLLTDVSDVAWQAAIPLPDRLLTVAQENIAITQCPFNRRWLETFFPQTSAPMVSRPVICCGLMSGSRQTVLEYLDHYLADVAQRVPPLTRGHDTAVLAMYAYQTPEVRIRPYRNPYWMHLGYAEPETVQADDGVIRIGDQVPAVIHQYNRHPTAQATLEARWM